MPKAATTTILRALAKAGIKVESEARDRAEAELDRIELPVEDLIDATKKIVDREDYQRVHRDVRDWKDKARAAKTELDELRDAVDAGDSDNARKATEYKRKLEKMEPLVEAFLGTARKEWTAVAEGLPDEIKPFLAFPEKGEELSEDELVANWKKIQEYKAIGALKTTDGDPEGDGDGDGDGSPNQSRQSPDGSKAKKGEKDFSKMDGREAMAASYDYQPPKPSA